MVFDGKEFPGEVEDATPRSAFGPSRTFTLMTTTTRRWEPWSTPPKFNEAPEKSRPILRGSVKLREGNTFLCSVVSTFMAGDFSHLHCPAQEWLDELGSNGTGDDVIIAGAPACWTVSTCSDLMLGDGLNLMIVQKSR